MSKLTVAVARFLPLCVVVLVLPVIAAAQPNLQPTGITFAASTAVVGGTVFFDSGIRNIGNVDTGVFNIKWFVNGQEVGAYGSHAGVPAGQTVLDGNSQFSWTLNSPGTHSVTFAVDVDNHVLESNEGDNTGSVQVTVTGGPIGSGQPPVITLLGDNPLNHIQGCPFIAAGATATDTQDGDLTNSIIITGRENIDNPGLHTITYSVTDSSELSDVKTRQVVVFGVIGTPLCFVGKPAGKSPNLVVLVHGCCTDANDVRTKWESFGKSIAANIHAPAPEQWEIVVWDWSKDTIPTTNNYILCPNCFLEDASDAYNNAVMQGQNLANTIANSRYKYVHLLGHSAGANLIDVAAKELVRIYIQRNENPFIHLTFFDAFTLSDFDKDSYGFLPNNYQSYYSEHYVHRGLAFMDTSTDECLSNAFNFNITDWAHSSEEGGFAGHSWPHNWYERSVTFTSNTNTPPPGFKLSFEGGNDQFDKIDELYRPGEQCPLMNEGTRCQPAACWE